MRKADTDRMLVAVRDADLSTAQKAVLFALIALDSATTAISQASIAKATACSRRTVVRTLGDLRRAGWLAVEPEQRADGGRGANLYRITPPSTR